MIFTTETQTFSLLYTYDYTKNCILKSLIIAKDTALHVIQLLVVLILEKKDKKSAKQTQD